MDKNVGIILDKIAVTPFAGVWIEIISEVKIVLPLVMSLPSRECGLKYL